MNLNPQDLNAILRQLNKQPEYTSYADKAISDQFDKLKTEMLADFDNHPITVEIEGGIDASNSSRTLNGITNLYSFIGFENGDRPTEVIRQMLKQSAFRKIVQNNSIITYIFEIPTAKQIFLATPLPWETGRSWAKGIEEGISGLGYYVKQVKNSRSGLGVQSENKVRDGVRFKNIAYISNLINKYNKKIQELEKSIL